MKHMRVLILSIILIKFKKMYFWRQKIWIFFICKVLFYRSQHLMMIITTSQICVAFFVKGVRMLKLTESLELNSYVGLSKYLWLIRLIVLGSFFVSIQCLDQSFCRQRRHFLVHTTTTCFCPVIGLDLAWAWDNCSFF